MPLFAWLLAAVGPMLIQGAISLGVATVTYVGFDAVVSSLLSSARANWAGLPGAAASFAALAGLNQAVGIIAGGITTRLSLIAVKKFKLK